MHRFAWVAALVLASATACGAHKGADEKKEGPRSGPGKPVDRPREPVENEPPYELDEKVRVGDELEIGGPITGATTLLEYVDWDDAPTFCRSPKAMLSHLDELLDSDTCDAQRVGDGDRAKIWLACRREQTAAVAGSTCDVEYDGRLWIVRSPDSESNYSLLAQGTVTRVCRTSDGRERPTPATATDTAEQRQTAHELEEKLRPCQKP